MTKIGVLENAFDISVTRRVNELWTASFSLPKNDKKNDLCSHLYYVDITSPTGRYYGLYRIMPTMTSKSESDDKITYTCHHVLSTLMDDVLDGYHQFTNQTTRYVLHALLDRQETKHWRLGDVDFTRYFHYAFENENGLLAPILSIPEPFNEPFEFTFDTTSYPWTLNLKRAPDDVKAEIRWGKDMISFEEVSDPSSIVNYIIPKGSGEGVNRLTIADVNGGRHYLKDDESIAKWGKISYIWIDRRFEDAESLKASAQALLDKWKEPTISFTANAADLSVLPEYAHERRVLNGVTRIIVEHKTYYGRIIEENIPDLSEEYNVDYKIANRLDDIATIQADIEHKQQINDAYSQGATNIISFNYQDNCDSNIPAVIPFYIDDDVVNVNTCELNFRTKRFRAYSQATKGGGAIVKSSGGGGGTTRSTSSGGGTSTSTQSGGGTTRSTPSGGGHRHRLFVDNGTASGTLQKRRYFGFAQEQNYSPTVQFESSEAGSIYTFDADGDHTHSVTIPAHTHNFSVPNHTHDIVLSNHTHEINLPNHTHEVEHKIVELSSLPSSVVIRVDGNVVPHTGTIGDRINLADYMAKDATGKVARGRHEVSISPNGLARIEADIILRVYIQSHLGGAM
ncbi:MAG TPA: hypothetical protein DCO80_02375 [Ornithinibacillus sp.]|nr:hypothetical protein [Ornithinibacillus sp.]